MTAWLWNEAGRWVMRLGGLLHRAGIALCGLAGDFDARADQAGYWTDARSERLQQRSGLS